MPDFTTGYLLGSSNSSCDDDVNIEIARCSSISNEYQRMNCFKKLQEDYEKHLNIIGGVELIILIVTLSIIAYFVIQMRKL